ncbi:Alkanal monooxygenase alpha chain [Mycobacterium talmoniae]|uniref:Alkanal monooxygenase alpha chain n=1 Tax=Mycobacterium talmoniae TaxID=1858794 RepID=A0A2S8BQ63_9MYCO|nr:Alkanal monooxygenase alpha chain [Mycobacterium talmoniae]
MFTLRFDMRAPESGAPTTELYAAAIEMCAWAEKRGAIAAVLSEHHGTEDGHLPAPLLLAAAIAARTERLAIMLAAVVLPFWDPVRLAEEMSVLDIISNGRVSYALGIGHRAAEYEHFGVDLRRRGQLADAKLALLLRLLRGEPVSHQGRRIHVTPRCVTPGGPPIMLAGGSPAAAKRAARHGLGLLAQANPPGSGNSTSRNAVPTDTNRGRRGFPTATRRPPCSSPTMWTRPGTNSGRTCFMTR